MSTLLSLPRLRPNTSTRVMEVIRRGSDSDADATVADARRLMSIQRKISRGLNRALVGAEAPVLVEGLSKETDLLWEARMPTQAPDIDGVVWINDFEGEEPVAGEIRRLRVTEAHDYDLVGTLLARHRETITGALIHINPIPNPQPPTPAL